MKNLFKKISALVMTAIMVLTMCATVFAADGTSAGHVTIKGIDAENGVTVTAYKIIKYNANGTYEAVLSAPVIVDNGEVALTAEKIQELAGKTEALAKENKSVAITGKDGADYIADLDYGTWMIIVSGSQKVLYNPAVVSVGINDKGEKVYGSLDLSDPAKAWTQDGVVIMKKSEPTITKTASPATDRETAVIGTQYGDIIKYTIEADIPSYASKATNISYSISDRLDGLSLVTTPAASATVGGNADDTLTGKVTAAVTAGNTSFIVTDLGNEWLLAHRGQKIVITYYAQVTSDAKFSVDLNTNTATLDYSVNDTTQSKSSKTQHYTFGIDTTLTGTAGEGTPSKTGEFIKINSDGKVEYNEKGEIKYTEKTELLSGAEFQLRIGNADGPLFTDAAGENTFTTKNGRLEINGLDSDVTYYLVETKAPTGYKLLSTPIPVKIDASFEGDVLIGYTVKIGNIPTYYTYNEKEGVTTLVNDKDHASNPYGFTNTKLGELPSTGGMGTYLFTIVGVVLMACAAGAFFISRRKTEE